MKAKLFFTFSLLLGFLLSNAQSPTFTLFKEIDQNARFVKIDLLGNCYISDASVLYKYDRQFNQQYAFSDFSIGSIHSVDVSNPMKILLFSKDFMRLTFLNNTLANQNKPYLLTDLNIMQAACVCSSYDNGFWVFDEVTDALIRFDANARKVSESKTINQIVGCKLQPLQMQEMGNKYLLICDTINGLIVFDLYGTYLKTIPIKDIKSFSIWKDQVVFVKENNLTILNMDNIQTLTMALPQPGVKDAVLYDKYLILLNAKGKISVYMH